jgi:hypothetical protein
MRSIFLIAVLAIVVSSCKKEKNSSLTNEQPKIEQSYKWGSNEDRYLNVLKSFKNEFKGFNTTESTFLCTSSGQDSTYGFFQDSMIIEGPYVTAKAEQFELAAQNCMEFHTVIDSAKAYLIAEGFSDIVDLWYNTPKSHWVVYAANTVIDLKGQLLASYARDNQTEKLWNCVLQAIGYTAAAELIANWAHMSRQAIVKAVGKLARKHLGVFGAIIAVGSFIDCMWG